MSVETFVMQLTKHAKILRECTQCSEKTFLLIDECCFKCMSKPFKYPLESIRVKIATQYRMPEETIISCAICDIPINQAVVILEQGFSALWAFHEKCFLEIPYNMFDVTQALLKNIEEMTANEH